MQRHHSSNPFGRSPITQHSFQHSISMSSIVAVCQHEKLVKLIDNVYECIKCKKTFDVNVNRITSHPPVYHDSSFVQKNMWDDLQRMKRMKPD